MTRTIYLAGELGTRFIESFEADVETPHEALKLVEANFPEFRSYLIEAEAENIGFIVDVAGQDLDVQELILPLAPGDITITPAPIGSKSGLGKILAAIVIVGLMFTPLGPGGATLASQIGAGGLVGFTALTAASLAVNLALTGIQQLMAPDPSVDDRGPQSYLFNGSENNIVEGDPVPVLYGQLRVPGRPISFSVVSTNGINNGNNANNVIPGFGGHYNMPDVAIV